MIDALSRADSWLFLTLNAGAANPFFDWLMPIVTEVRNWAPLIIAGLLGIAIFGGGKGRTVVLLSIIMITASDQLASHVIKPLIGRTRPCHDVEGVRLLYRCGKTFAFPSGHATSSMAAAIFFGMIYRRWLWPLVAISVLVSYSRIYIGVHYPFDTAGGWLIGGALAALFLWVYRRWLQPFMNRYHAFRATTPVISSG
jgi:undecaprenyl-diphosphatase